MLRTPLEPLMRFNTVNKLQVLVRRFTPRRGLLYVPADNFKKIDKAFNTDADCITLDCEDGVATNKKIQARLNIREVLDRGKPMRKRKYDFCVRLNSVDSDILKDDLSVIASGKNLPDTFYLPKVENPEHIQLFSDHLSQYVKKQTKVSLIIAIESPLALINVVNICRMAVNMSDSRLEPVALLFGSDDYCANIGAQRSETSVEVIYARQKLVSVAKAFNLQAIDMVYVKYQDLEGLKKQAEEGAQLGFSGKQMIHPRQIEITQNAFSPTREQIEWARGVSSAFLMHQQQGQGAFSYKGHMVDMPTIRQAQNIIDLLDAIRQGE